MMGIGVALTLCLPLNECGSLISQIAAGEVPAAGDCSLRDASMRCRQLNEVGTDMPICFDAARMLCWSCMVMR